MSCTSSLSPSFCSVLAICMVELRKALFFSCCVLIFYSFLESRIGCSPNILLSNDNKCIFYVKVREKVRFIEELGEVKLIDGLLLGSKK